MHFTNSHTLPKIAISLALLFSSANIAFAEESGGFVGFGIGGGGTKYIYKDTTANGKKRKVEISRGGINYGFVAGYKQFFNEYLGLRYYVNLDIHHNMTKHKDYDIEKYDITLLNYGANVDFLGNFLVTEMVDFGGFIGLGIGGNSLFGKFIKDLRSVAREVGYKFSNIGFDAWLNVGLHTNIAKYHGLEIVARVPFLPVKMVDEYSISHKETFGQTYSVLARYTFSF